MIDSFTKTMKIKKIFKDVAYQDLDQIKLILQLIRKVRVIQRECKTKMDMLIYDHRNRILDIYVYSNNDTDTILPPVSNWEDSSIMKISISVTIWLRLFELFGDCMINGVTDDDVVDAILLRFLNDFYSFHDVLQRGRYQRHYKKLYFHYQHRYESTLTLDSPINFIYISCQRRNECEIGVQTH